MHRLTFVLSSISHQWLRQLNLKRQISLCCPLLKDFNRTLEPVHAPDSADILLKSLRVAAESNDVLSFVQKHHLIMNCSHLMQALRTIFNLQKSEVSEMSVGEIIKSPAFRLLVNCLLSKSRSLDLNDALDALKILTFLRINASTKIISVLLQLIVKEVNDLSLQQLVFLDFLIKDFNSTPLVEALKIALPIVFQANLKLKVDYSNVQQLADLLRFVTKKQMSQQNVDLLVDLIMKQRHNLDLKSSITIVRSICDYRDSEESLRPLLHFALDKIIDYEHVCSFATLESVLHSLTNRFSLYHDYFYHEEFVSMVSSYIVKKNSGFEAAAWMLRKTNKFGHINYELLDYCAECAEAEPWALESGRASVALSMVHGFALADRKPKNWSRLEQLVLANASSQNDVALPWINFLRDLATLDTWHHPLIARVFAPQFLEQFLSRDYNSLDHLQLLSLSQAVKTLCPEYKGPYPSAELLAKAISYNGTHVDDFPLEGALVHGLGGHSFFLTGVYTNDGQFIDHLLAVNTHGSPLSLSVTPRSDGRIYVEDVQAPGRTLIAILAIPSSAYSLNMPNLRGPFRLALDVLKAGGLTVVPVSMTRWALVPEREKIPWLMRCISKECPSLSLCNNI